MIRVPFIRWTSETKPVVLLLCAKARWHSVGRMEPVRGLTILSKAVGFLVAVLLLCVPLNMGEKTLCSDDRNYDSVGTWL